jgi:type I restriction enzyme S subunit
MKKYRLNEICSIRTGKTPSTKIESNFSNCTKDFMFITPSDIKKNGLIYKTERYITSIGSSGMQIIPPNSILITTIGTIGKIVINPKKSICNQQINFLSNFNRQLVCKNYLYYKLVSKKKELEKLGSGGTTMPNIKKSILENFEVHLPPLDVQKEIADKISVYDDKIENNNKIIELLEEKASLLYKRYFVDFEFPNEEGLPYKSSGGEFKESEEGKIPVDWEIMDAKQFFDFITGFEPGAKNYVENFAFEDYIQFFRVKDLNVKQNIYIEKTIVKKKNHVNREEVLVSFDGTIGRVVCGYSGTYSSGIKKVKPKCDYIDNSFIYFYMKSNYIQNVMKEHATGTTILHASKAIDYMKICVSKKKIISFIEFSAPIYQYIQNANYENEILTEKRDLLIKELIKL